MRDRVCTRVACAGATVSLLAVSLLAAPAAPAAAAWRFASALGLLGWRRRGRA